MHTLFTGTDLVNAAVHFNISGVGPNAWFGWHDISLTEKLTLDWARATDPAKRKQLGESIRKIVLREVAELPWGKWILPTVFRKNIQGLLSWVRTCCLSECQRGAIYRDRGQPKRTQFRRSRVSDGAGWIALDRDGVVAAW